MSVSLHRIEYGSRSLAYSLTRSSRRTLSISVQPSGEVTVRAPSGASDAQIARIVQKRARWIARNLDRRPSEPLAWTPPRIASGAAFRYLGRQYRMRVVKSDHNKVSLTRGRLVFEVTDPQSDRTLRRLLDRWLASKATERFSERVEECVRLFPDQGRVAPTGMLIRQLKTRWGSMTPSGKIVLNRSLLHAPVACIDYVIAHELCHRLHANHTRAFWKSLRRAMPDWSERKTRLERTSYFGEP